MNKTIPSLIRLGLVATLCFAGYCRGADAPSPTPGATPAPAASPHVSGTLPAPVTPKGPLLTPEREKEVFSALDLSPDALKPVADAVAKEDYPTAEHALAEYFRHRTSPAWKLAAPNPSLIKDPVAEDAVKGRVQGGLVLAWYTFPDNKIDWTFNPTLNTPGMVPSAEWQWQLCRMAVWSTLGNAYRATGDERYTKAWLDQFHSFAAQCLPPPDHIDNGRPGSAWRTIDNGIRLGGAWETAFFSFLASPQFTDADVTLFLYAFLENSRYLRQFHGPGNGLMMEMSGIYTVGSYLPEFKEAADWRNYAVTRMRTEEHAQILPDGVEDELSTMYHNTAIDNFMGIARVAKLAGRTSDLPDGYIADMEKSYDFDLYMMTPDRAYPEFNDGLSFHLTGFFKTAAEFFPERKDFRWVVSSGTDGQAPAETSHAFPYAGFYVMRSGWDTQANYLVLRAGPLGVPGHHHQDKLNVIMSAYGRGILINSGGAAYERSIWRGYSIDTYSKNTVLVDGKPQRRDPTNPKDTVSKAPIDARWESTPDHDFAAGVYDEGYGNIGSRPATHTRRVLFVKPDLFIVADTLVPNDKASHTYQARWNLMSTKTQQDDVTHSVTTMDERNPNLAIIPLQLDNLEVRSASAQTTPELLGWAIRKDRNPPNIPATTVLHTKKGTGTQNFLTLLFPIQKGATSPVTSVKTEGPDSATVTFNDGRVVSIVADPDPKGGIEVTEPNHDVKVAAASH